MGIFSQLKLLITVGLTIFDMGSDIMLAMDYYNTGEDWWWFTLALTFFLLPMIVLAMIGLYFLCSTSGFDPDLLKAWKVFECMAESGPQLILQLYIMALPSNNIVPAEEDTNSTAIINITTQLHSFIYETTTVNESVSNVTDHGDIFSSDGTDISFTLVLQVITIITSLLSISWGATSFKAEQEEDMELLELGIELIWNILCISSRIIALSLFATIYRYWFAGMVIFHIIIIFFAILLKDTDENSGVGDWVVSFIFGLGFGIGYLFNVLLVEFAFESYVFYMGYWLVLMVETTILISVWYVKTNGEDLWYHDTSIACIIPAYFISFVIKTLHVSTFEGNKERSILNWQCSKTKAIAEAERQKYEMEDKVEEEGNNNHNGEAFESVA